MTKSSEAVTGLYEDQKATRPDERIAGDDPGENGARQPFHDGTAEQPSSGTAEAEDPASESAPRLALPAPPRAAPPPVNVGSWERRASAAAGSALAAYGLKRGSWLGGVLALLGGGLIYRGVSGHCAAYGAMGVSTAPPESSATRETAKKLGDHGIKVERSVTVSRARSELYSFWRDFGNLPQFMNHLESVTTQDGHRSHWVAAAPLGRTVAWDAEIINEEPNHLIAWKSLPGADVDSAGSVRFKDAPGDRGTVVTVSLTYAPPAGAVGAAVARLLGEEPNAQVEDDLRRFKNRMEAGEIPTTQGQPSGQRSLKGKFLQTREG